MKRILIILALTLSLTAFSQVKHPNLILTQEGVKVLRDGLGKYPLLDKTFDAAKAEVEANLAAGIEVPVPVDAGGGYTHEKHKSNYSAMNKAGVLWQVLNDTRYAEFVKEMLLAYAKLYPTLGIHPEGKNSSAPGKLFWQSLNDAVWLVNAIQAYDAVFDYISASDRQIIENNLFRLAVKFNIVDCNKVFNMIHNHGAWNVAGVIMTGYVLNDNEMIEQGLKGGNKDGKSGFFELISKLYSPDGYYVEGPYYLRYAYWPFGLTATVIDNNQPAQRIFAFKDSTLLKAPLTLLQMTDSKGQFLPFNDAIREKAWTSQEVISAVDIAYSRTNNPDLLYVAEQQDCIMLSKEGVAVAKAIAEQKASTNFRRHSMLLRDGSDGKQGATGFLRYGDGKDQLSLIMKYGVYGMEHGHFDKLSMMLYDQSKLIISDYGAVRFLNIVQKRGGRYLPENKTWGKQTVAHNTVVVDETAQYKAESKIADDKHAEAYFFDISNPAQQVMSAYDSTAYPNVKMQRTMAMLANETWEKPVIIDLFRLVSPAKHTYDLPLYYNGSLIETSVKYASHQTWEALGKKYGYQHLFNTADGKAESDQLLFTWYNDERFYSVNATATPETEVFFVQLGANDPEMSLRPEKGFIIRNTNVDTFTFASIIEPHGEYNEPFEYVNNSYSKFDTLTLLLSDNQASILKFKEKNGNEWLFAIANNNTDPKAIHTHTIGNQQFKWTGVYLFEKYEASKYVIPAKKSGTKK
ncbi:hypothetical protein FACS1894201_03900 [Bacteroidia bacterium]|nr:hypothetical protein FACS1894201_03900 [Bacteroidia bacterium]